MYGTPLKEIVEEYLLEEERDTKSYFYLYLQYAISGLKIFHREVDGHVKTKKLTLSSTNTAPLPEDFIKMTKLFALDQNGGVTALSENKSIYKGVDSCGNMMSSPVSTNGNVSYDYFSQHWRNGESIGGYYGAGGRSTAGEYKINLENNRIELSSVLLSNQIILEYLGQKTPINGEFRVHPYLAEPVKDFIEFKVHQRKRGTSSGEKERLRRQWIDSMLQAKVDMWGEGLDDIVQATRKNFNQSPNF